MSWYQEWFGEDYIDVYTHRNEIEAEQFIETLSQKVALANGAAVLDLACGAGRYSIALAERGLHVTGIDLSEPLIQEATRQSADKGLSIDFQIRDMRDIPYEGHFDAILNMFTSFGYFESDEENFEVFESAAKALKKGGWFVQDFMNKSYVLDHLNEYDEFEKGEIVIKQSRSYNSDTNRIEKDIHMIRSGEEKIYKESVKLYDKVEIGSMFERSGIEQKSCFGNYDGSPFEQASPRLITIGQR